jgi:uncharacterized protein (TIGR00369 family)
LPESRITVAEIADIVRAELPLAGLLGVRIDRLEYGRATVRMPYAGQLIRPGGTIAGPALMGLADFAMYAVTLSMIGRVELAVTTSLSINFLRKPAPRDVIAEAAILKLGRRLAVSQVSMFSDGEAEPVAHVTGTYSIPPQPGPENGGS